MATAKDALIRYIETPLDELLGESTGDVETESVLAQHQSMARLAATDVPAYKAFIADESSDVVGAEHAKNLSQIPYVTKDNYFRKFPMSKRCWDGRLDKVDFVHCSSGSSGTPQFWPRSIQDEILVTARFEQAFRDSFKAHERLTLVIVCFPLGSWVGGMFTAKCIHYLTLKGYKITMCTPGNKPEDILRLAADLCPLYEQTVLAGYPPFMKGVVDLGTAKGIPWREFGIKLVLAGEVFSEEWRRLMGERCGMVNATRDVVSLYGTADAGVIATETELSATIRCWLAEHPRESKELFGKERLPTLCQYDPSVRFLEVHPEDATLVVTSLAPEKTSAAPLIRHRIGDDGGVISFDDLLSFLEKHGYQPSTQNARSQPFVWVFGRSFWTMSLFGANVYVENVMVGLEQPNVQPHVTGKFVLFVHEDEDMNKRLAIRVELVPGQEESDNLKATVGESVKQNLIRLNSEYANYVPEEAQMPKIWFHKFGDPEYFPVGVKHKYTI